MVLYHVKHAWHSELLIATFLGHPGKHPIDTATRAHIVIAVLVVAAGGFVLVLGLALVDAAGGIALVPGAIVMLAGGFAVMPGAAVFAAAPS